MTRLTRRTVARLTCPGPATHADHGPGPYEPSPALKALLRARFRTCQFPTCSRPAHLCQLDHTIRHPDGPTCLCNLAPLCVRHHQLKHHAPGWQLINHGDGTITWITPTGHRIHVTDTRHPPNHDP